MKGSTVFWSEETCQRFIKSHLERAQRKIRTLWHPRLDVSKMPESVTVKQRAFHPRSRSFMTADSELMVIEVNSLRMAVATRDSQWRKLLLHELAHILTDTMIDRPEYHHHGAVWKSVCLALKGVAKRAVKIQSL